MYNLYLLLIIPSKIETKLFPDRQETTHFHQEKLIEIRATLNPQKQAKY